MNKLKKYVAISMKSLAFLNRIAFNSNRIDRSPIIGQIKFVNKKRYRKSFFFLFRNFRKCVHISTFWFGQKTAFITQSIVIMKRAHASTKLIQTIGQNETVK